MKIEIIIPNYNGFELVSQNLPKILEIIKNEKNMSVVLVDDGSKRDEQENLQKFITDVKKTFTTSVTLLMYDKNLGFSSNVNRAALKSDADILILFNTDVMPDKDFLNPLIAHFSDPTVFGVACMDQSIEDEKTVLRGRGLAKWHKGFLVHRKGEVNKSDTFWVSGGSSAVRTSLFKKLGGFDSLYNPFYWEDIDLSYRAQKCGYKLIFEEKSIVTHMHTKGSIKKHYKDNIILSYAMRNQFTFIWKNITDISLILSHILLLPKYLLSAVIRRDVIFLKGFCLAFLRLPDIMKHRKIQKKQFILTDKEILSRYL